MHRFLHSPLRGWRWLYSFFGILTASVAVYVFVDWPVSGDRIMLVFPAILLTFGLGWLYIGTVVNDEALARINRFIQQLGV